MKITMIGGKSFRLINLSAGTGQMARESKEDSRVSRVRFAVYSEAMRRTVSHRLIIQPSALWDTVSIPRTAFCNMPHLLPGTWQRMCRCMLLTGRDSPLAVNKGKRIYSQIGIAPLHGILSVGEMNHLP